MLKEFKNLELTRHYFSTDIEDNIDLLSKQVKQGTKEIASTVFATATSLALTYLIYENWFDLCSVLINVILIILSFSIIFVLAYTLFSIAYKTVIIGTKAFKIYPQPNYDEIKEAIDNFDHIACDCILIAFEFIESYKDIINPNPASPPTDVTLTKKDEQLLAFYYFEILYYLRKSIENTALLIKNHVKYMKTPDKERGVDVFRIQNISLLMLEILAFVESNKNNIAIDNTLKQTLYNQIKVLHENIEEINIGCQDFIKDKYSLNKNP